MTIRKSSHALTPLTDRVRAEYTEVPGLRLTVVQASRFLGLDPSTCERALEELECAGVLLKCPDGRYQQAEHVRKTER